jgi:hypothetical protein
MLELGWSASWSGRGWRLGHLAPRDRRGEPNFGVLHYPNESFWRIVSAMSRNSICV